MMGGHGLYIATLMIMGIRFKKIRGFISNGYLYFGFTGFVLGFYLFLEKSVNSTIPTIQAVEASRFHYPAMEGTSPPRTLEEELATNVEKIPNRSPASD